MRGWRVGGGGGKGRGSGGGVHLSALGISQQRGHFFLETTVSEPVPNSSM